MIWNLALILAFYLKFKTNKYFNFMKRSNWIIIFLLLIGVNLNAQIIIPKKDYVPEVRQSRYSFAISLISGVNSAPISFGIMRENPDSTHEVIFLTIDAFMRQVAGNESSRANPEKINYFKEYEIDSQILIELWKLKYAVNPYSDEVGWGTELGVPSKAQFGMLSEFGVTKMSDYIFGDNLWKFLLKVSDPLWVGQYQNQH